MTKLKWTSNRTSTNRRWMVQEEYVRGEGAWRWLIELGQKPLPGWVKEKNLSSKSEEIARAFDPPKLKEGTVVYAKALAQFIEDIEDMEDK